LREELNKFLRNSLSENKKLRQLQDIKTIASWYGQMKEYRKEKADGLVSIVTNRIIGKLLEHVEPFYTKSIVNKIGIETEFKEGTADMNFEVKLAPIKPHVEFIKRLNGNRVSSTNFRFLLESTAYLKKIRIVRLNDGKYPDRKSIEIGKTGIELQLSLEQIEGAVYYLSKPIKLASKKFDINDLSFHFRP
jgi:hypothetical protein